MYANFSLEDMFGFLRIGKALNIFGRRPDPDEPLDPEEIENRLNEGLDEVSDATRRTVGDGRYPNLGDMTVEDAELARRIQERLEDRRYGMRDIF